MHPLAARAARKTVAMESAAAMMKKKAASAVAAGARVVESAMVDITLPKDPLNAFDGV